MNEPLLHARLEEHSPNRRERLRREEEEKAMEGEAFQRALYLQTQQESHHQAQQGVYYRRV